MGVLLILAAKVGAAEQARTFYVDMGTADSPIKDVDGRVRHKAPFPRPILHSDCGDVQPSGGHD